MEIAIGYIFNTSRNLLFKGDLQYPLSKNALRTQGNG